MFLYGPLYVSLGSAGGECFADEPLLDGGGKTRTATMMTTDATRPAMSAPMIHGRKRGSGRAGSGVVIGQTPLPTGSVRVSDGKICTAMPVEQVTWVAEIG